MRPRLQVAGPLWIRKIKVAEVLVSYVNIYI
jgi:hypothetical protein